LPISGGGTRGIASFSPGAPNFEGEVLQWTDILCDDRTAVQAALREQGIDSRAFWFPLHRQEPYRSDDREFPHSIDISARGIWLPSAFDLTKDHAKTAAQAVRAAVSAA
jgi:dTDP-4-amino-4,6-dideoxygalactose transaminase